MRQAATVVHTPSGRRRLEAGVLFQSLVPIEPESRAGRRSATLFFSLFLHSGLLLAVAGLPLLLDDALPNHALRNAFVPPLQVAPPPPPPPARMRGPLRSAPKIETRRPQALIPPVEVPSEIKPEQALDPGEGGGGVEGGVPDGVVGGVLDELPTATPPPPARVVRIGERIRPPQKIHDVAPAYPSLGIHTRIAALVIVEAEVDTRGLVKSVKVVRGHPLFDAAAIEAVQQWRYEPLLLNGEPTGFILTVTIHFHVRSSD